MQLYEDVYPTVIDIEARYCSIIQEILELLDEKGVQLLNNTDFLLPINLVHNPNTFPPGTPDLDFRVFDPVMKAHWYTS